MGLDMFVAGQEDVVVLIQIEFLITQGGALGKQFEPQTVGLHIDRRADAHAQFIFLVVESQACQCPMVVDMSVDETVEYELRVLAVIAYLTLIGEPVSLLREVQADGVDTGAVVV